MAFHPVTSRSAGFLVDCAVQDVEAEDLDHRKRQHDCGISAFVRRFCSISLSRRAALPH